MSSEQEQTYTNSHPPVEAPATDLPAAGGANSGTILTEMVATLIFQKLYLSLRL